MPTEDRKDTENGETHETPDSVERIPAQPPKAPSSNGGRALALVPIGTAVVLFALMFLWQPPHFWALAINLEDDYRHANFPMLPVVVGVPETIRSMIAYQMLLVGLGLALPIVCGMAGGIFAVPFLVTGLVPLALMFRLRKNPDRAHAKRIFRYTILHVVVWHIALTADIALHRPLASWQ